MSEPCTECGYNAPIVNKKYGLCGNCNYKRLHDGKSKQEVYAERRKSKNGELPQRKNKKCNIRNISKLNSYKCSDGSKVTQSEINRRYVDTCTRIKQEREPICQGTGRTDLPLSFSHTISRKRCKEIGRTELIWADGNIEIESYTPPGSNSEAAHNIWDAGNLEKKKTLLNFDRKLEYIKENDYEQYVKLSNEEE